ncbi:MAG: Nif3-like dinuclear metal center hexameric protein [Elusimicrobia bacterium]|nr:Nif3-like dinuclear metal center hexameric protein [Elusimicrobiota bacterium]
MKAKEVMEHFQKVGTWVHWDKTCDLFLHGNPDMEVKGIATSWIPTNASLQQASDKGLNLFITHEPAFFTSYQGTVTGDQLINKKKKLLDEFGITLIRCHDTWDRMPEVGIPDAWGKFLGFETEERQLRSYYKTCLMGNITLEEVANKILNKVKPLGQDTVLILGDRKKKIERLVIGTGAITNLPYMIELKPDAILATDDGINTWNGGLWSIDLDMPLLIVNHATAEKPGMQAMAGYLKQIFPNIPVEYIDVPFPYSSIK